MTQSHLHFSLLLIILTVVLSTQSQHLPVVFTQANRLLQILLTAWLIWIGYIVMTTFITRGAL